MKTLLFVSILVNLLFCVFFAVFLRRKGGLVYLKSKIAAIPEKDHYYRTRVDIFEEVPGSKGGVMFLGDSITDFAEWNDYFPDLKIINRGISGDVIDGVMKRKQQIINQAPDKLFLMIGTNDLGKGFSAGSIADKSERLICFLKDSLPATSIFIQSVLPVSGNNIRSNDDIVRLNTELEKIVQKQENMVYVDLHSLFVDESGCLKDELTFDGLHINGKGYTIWADYIKELV